MFDNHQAARVILMIIRMSKENSNQKHLREMAPGIKAIIDRHSGGNNKLAFSDPDGYGFGYLLKTNSPLRVLQAELYGTSAKSSGAVLLHGDSYLALEVGKEFDGVGFSAAWTWLQHHHN